LRVIDIETTMNESKSVSSKEEWSTVEHALAYLNKADNIPHRTEGEAVLLDHVPKDAKRILDLGTGDGRLIRLLKIDNPKMEAVALDTSPTMLKAARQYFSNNSSVKIAKYDLTYPLHKSLGRFDAVVSSLTIHHLSHKRKRSLYKEIYDMLNPLGVFCNLDNVASPSLEHHIRFLHAIGFTPETESKSDKLLSMETQLHWLHDIGFVDVDCYWKWLEMALLIGYRK
jgi:tRNA (cmo5U34)-methyltransferase